MGRLSLDNLSHRMGTLISRMARFYDSYLTKKPDRILILGLDWAGIIDY